MGRNGQPHFQSSHHSAHTNLLALVVHQWFAGMARSQRQIDGNPFFTRPKRFGKIRAYADYDTGGRGN